MSSVKMSDLIAEDVRVVTANDDKPQSYPMSWTEWSLLRTLNAMKMRMICHNQDR